MSLAPMGFAMVRMPNEASLNVSDMVVVIDTEMMQN
jgi:hypothetical protein